MADWPWLLASDKLISFTSHVVWLVWLVSRTSQGDGSAVVWPNKTSSSPGCCLSACMMAHHVSSNWWLCLLLLPLPIHSINQSHIGFRPPASRCPVTAVPWIPAGTPILVPPQKPPPVFRIRPPLPPHSPIPRSGFDTDQAGITAQVCVHCGIGIPIRLICTTASDEPGTYPHTFSTAHSPLLQVSQSRGFTFFSPHTHRISPCPHLAPRTSRTSPSPLPLSPCRRRNPTLLPPPDCLPQQGAVLTPSPPQPVRRPLESPPLSLDAIPSTRLREGRKRVQRLRVGPRVASPQNLLFFATRRRTTIHSSHATTLSPKRLQHTHAGLDSASVGERIEGVLDAVH